MEQQKNNMMQQMFGENYEIENATKPVGINHIFEEIYRRNNPDAGEEEIKDKMSSSRDREKLNEMFDALFDKKYEEVLLGDKDGYAIYGKGIISTCAVGFISYVIKLGTQIFSTFIFLGHHKRKMSMTEPGILISILIDHFDGCQGPAPLF